MVLKDLSTVAVEIGIIASIISALYTDFCPNILAGSEYTSYM